MDTETSLDQASGGDADYVEVVSDDPQSAGLEPGTPTGKQSEAEADGQTPEEALESIDDIDSFLDEYRSLPDVPPAPVVEEVKPVARKVKAVTPLDHEVIRLKQENPTLEFSDAIQLAKANLGIVEAKPAPEPEPVAEVIPDDGEPKTPEEALKKAREFKKLAIAAGKELEYDQRGEYEDEEVRYLELADKLREDAKEAERKAVKDAEMVSEYDRAFDESAAKAVSLYPDAGIPTSALGRKVAELDAALKAAGDPVYHSPSKPLILASLAAAELGLSKSVPSIPTPPSRPKPFALSASGAAHTSTPPDRRQTDANAALDDLDPQGVEDLMEMLMAGAS